MSEALDSSAAKVKAISANAALICDAITTVSSVTWFSQKLEEKCLITSQVGMNTTGRSPYEECNNLLNAVKVQVQADPSNFAKFLEIFQNEDALKHYADRVSESLSHCELTLHSHKLYHRPWYMICIFALVHVCVCSSMHLQCTCNSI